MKAREGTFSDKSLTMIKKEWFYLFFAFLTVVYLFFPNHNPLVDSIGYAADIKYGSYLFPAHHLLFTAFNFSVYKLIVLIIPSVDAHHLMQLINVAFSLLNLLLLRKILKKCANPLADFWVVFAAVSFGVFRFSVEAETYIIPVFFSLCSSLFFFDFKRTDNLKYVVLSSIFASIACLFHQIHLFWGIGLFVGFAMTRKLKIIISFVLPTLSVIVVYALVLVYYNHISFSFSNLFHFVAQYYYTDNATASQIGANSFLLLFIGIFRTFFQIHGIVPLVLHWLPAFYIFAAISLILLIYFLIKFFSGVRLKQNNPKSVFEFVHILIFILQICFAFFSSGNSEFLVMIPFLIAIFFPCYFHVNKNILVSFSLAMFIWNFSFGILPNSIFDYQHNNELTDYINKNSDKVFILKESDLVSNIYYYRYGVLEYKQIIDKADQKAITKFKQKEKVFVTDVLSKKTPYNRKDFSSASEKDNLKFINHLTRFETPMGGFFLDQVDPK